MAKFFDALTDGIIDFIGEQKMFFIATAPHEGRINLSPKGMNTFRVLDTKTVAYLDLTGSGNETSAHIKDDGRVTIMMCSFSQKPLILRLYGHGKVIRPAHPEWTNYFRYFTAIPGQRQIVVTTIESIQTSCGFAVPVFELKEERQMLVEFACRLGEEKIEEYRTTKNIQSIDGLPTGLLER